MTLLVLAYVALAAGPRDRHRRRPGPAVLASASGSRAASVVLAVALACPPRSRSSSGASGSWSRPLVRAMAVAWSAGLAVLGLLEVAVGGRPTVVGPSLVGLAVAAVALATRDPASSIAALAAGGVAASSCPGLRGWLDRPGFAVAPADDEPGRAGHPRLRAARAGRHRLGRLGGRAVRRRGAISGGSGQPVRRWGSRSSGWSPRSRIRCGLIPIHVWAARFMEGVSPLAIPAAFAWGSAAFVLVALDWSQVALGPAAAGDGERLLIVVLALGRASSSAGSRRWSTTTSSTSSATRSSRTRAWRSSPSPRWSRRSPPRRANWLVASATVKTALAAWAAVVRATYGGHRLADLGGWARHSPVLGVAFAGILVAAVGAARDGDLGRAGQPDRGAMPGRRPRSSPSRSRRCRRSTSAGSRSRASRRSRRRSRPAHRPAALERRSRRGLVGRLGRAGVRAVPAELRANRAPLMAFGVVALLAAMALATAMGGAGG